MIEKELEKIIKVLIEHQEELEKKYKVKEIGIYGSYVKSEQTKNSNLDMIVEFKDEKSIGGFEYISLMTDLKEYLEKLLGIKPHLASKSHAMSSNKWKSIEKEIVYVFGGIVSLYKVKEILQEFKREVKNILKDKLIEIILFGSYARGDYEFGSDIDVLLVMKEKLTKEEGEKVSDISCALSLKNDVVITCFDYLYESFQSWETPFLMNVKREGVSI